MSSKSSGLLAMWSRLPKGLRSVAATLASNRLVSGAFRAATRGRLRVLAYHGVHDLDYFEQSVAYITSRYHPVDGDEVIAYVEGRASLPANAVWFTFDDGLSSALAAAEILLRYRVSATNFVNPWTVEQGEPLWFQALEFATQRGLIGEAEQGRYSRSRLKSLQDHERRSEMARLLERLNRDSVEMPSLSGSEEMLRRWVSFGHEIGNHTWSHPCLDRCTEEEQRRQIERAHAWLTKAGFSPRFFAYPNGDWTPEAEAMVANLGYRASVLFDHRLVRHGGPVHQVSRLRVDSDASHKRLSAILSGAHSTAFSAISRRHRSTPPTALSRGPGPQPYSRQRP